MGYLPLFLHLPNDGKCAQVLVPIRNIHSFREVKDEESLAKGYHTRIFFLGDDEGSMTVAETIEDVMRQYRNLFRFAHNRMNNVEVKP